MDKRRATEAMNAYLMESLGIPPVPLELRIEQLSKKMNDLESYLSGTFGSTIEHRRHIRPSDIVSAVQSRSMGDTNAGEDYDEFFKELQNQEEREVEMVSIFLELIEMMIQRTRLVNELMHKSEAQTKALRSSVQNKGNNRDKDAVREGLDSEPALDHYLIEWLERNGRGMIARLFARGGFDPNPSPSVAGSVIGSGEGSLNEDEIEDEDEDNIEVENQAEDGVIEKKGDVTMEEAIIEEAMIIVFDDASG